MFCMKSVLCQLAASCESDTSLFLQAFWVPSQAPQAKDLMQKPDTATYCPASGKKLRLKDCVAVKFTPVPEGDPGRYMDPITKDTFTNASRLVVIAPTGVPCQAVA